VQHGTWGPADWAVTRRLGEPLTDYKARAARTAATHLYPVDADSSCHHRIPIEQPAWDRDPAGPPGDLAPMRRWGKAKAGHLLDGAEIQELPEAAYQTPTAGPCGPAWPVPTAAVKP
jgi:hypothetical protein